MPSSEGRRRRPSRSSTAKLQPGEDTIDRSTPWWDTARRCWRIAWSLCLPNGRSVQRTSQGKTKGQARARARATAAELLADSEQLGWKSDDPIVEYMDSVSLPAIDMASISENSANNYRAVLKLLRGHCDAHQHQHSMDHHTIESGTKLRAVEKCLQEIARLHGAETARQSKGVFSKYVIQQVVRDDLLPSNPLTGMSIDLKTGARVRTGGRRGGVALTFDEWNATIEYLLAFDPAVMVTPPKNSHVRYEQRWELFRGAADLIMLLAATGMRVTEANTLTWRDHATTTKEGLLAYIVSPEHSKTNMGRTVPVLDDRVEKHMLERRARRGDDGYVIGSPTDARRVWNEDNCRKKGTTPLYLRMRDDLDIPAFATERTHVWRATLNMLLSGQPEAIRSAYLGHDPSVNRRSYTDAVDIDGFAAAGRQLRRGS